MDRAALQSVILRIRLEKILGSYAVQKVLVQNPNPRQSSSTLDISYEGMVKPIIDLRLHVFPPVTALMLSADAETFSDF